MAVVDLRETLKEWQEADKKGGFVPFAAVLGEAIVGNYVDTKSLIEEMEVKNVGRTSQR